jgi:hypothetical protein
LITPFSASVDLFDYDLIAKWTRLSLVSMPQASR